MSAVVKDSDRGYRDLLVRMRAAASGGTVTIGIVAGAGSIPAKGGKGASLLDVATWNEFGIGVPERSFLRSSFDEKLEENQKILTALWKRVVAGKLTPVQAFNQLGLKMQGDVQRKISAGVPPPNAQSTIDAKGSSTPLVDTGQLRSSISYQIEGA